MNIALSIGMIFVSIFVGYLLGSISFSVVIGKLFFHRDPRLEGSHNAGGTNAGRVFGKKVGLIVILLDVLKTIISIWGIYFIMSYAIPKESLFMEPTYYAYISGFFACIGHTFPLFTHFKGGKAVSCYGGLLISINWCLALIGIAIFMFILWLKKYVSLSSILSTFIISIISFIPIIFPILKFGMDFGMIYDIVLPSFLLFMAFFVLVRHKENVKRLIKGEERKITWM